jgi:hypothetical protein
MLSYIGTTPSANTGPSSAQNGSYYMYTESSDANSPSVAFDLELDLRAYDAYTLSSIHGVEFFYSMYGAGQGSLEVQGSSNCIQWTTMWQKEGNQGPGWRSATAVPALSNHDSYDCLRFMGKTGSNYTSDMALDEITIMVAPSPTSYPTVTSVPTITPVPTVMPSQTHCDLLFEGTAHGLSNDQHSYFGEYTHMGPDTNQKPHFMSDQGNYVYVYGSSWHLGPSLGASTGVWYAAYTDGAESPIDIPDWYLWSGATQPNAQMACNTPVPTRLPSPVPTTAPSVTPVPTSSPVPTSVPSITPVPTTPAPSMRAGFSCAFDAGNMCTFTTGVSSNPWLVAAGSSGVV